MLVSAHNVAQVQRLLHRRGLTILFETPYMGGYIGGAGHQVAWLGDKVREWADIITMLTKVV